MRRAASAWMLALALPAAAADVHRELADIAARSGGVLGVSAVNLKTGERVRLNADQPFPMASTFKVAVAIKVLDLVDRGSLKLDDRIAIDPGNLSPGSSEMKNAEPDTEKTATVAELLNPMMRKSDNTATDYLLAAAGGAAAVTEHVRAMGIAGLRVDRPAANLVADAWGFELPPVGSRTKKNLARAQSAGTPEKRQAAARAFLDDPRDTTTPDAMAALLERLQAGKALGKASTEVLLDNMKKCRTGPRRIKGELPRGTVVAHKTGTLTRVATNDVGIVTLGGSHGRMVVALYLKASPQPIEAQERSLAQAALVLYRHFTR